MTRSLATGSAARPGGCAACSRQTPAPRACSRRSPPEAAPAAGARRRRASPQRARPQQATASQESGDGAPMHRTRSDTSLEHIAALPAPPRSCPGKWQPGVNYDPVVPGAADQRLARQGGGAGGVLARLPALLRARALSAQLAQDQARLRRVRARAGHLAADPPRARAALTTRSRRSAGRTWYEKAFDTLHQQHSRPASRPCSATTTSRLTSCSRQFAVQNGISADDVRQGLQLLHASTRPAARRGDHPALPRGGRAAHRRQRQVHHRRRQGGRPRRSSSS